MTTPAPGSTEWLRYITASKVPAIVGTSPYESRFSLWHRMAGNLPSVPQNTAMTRGNYLEPAIVAWLADQHPELHIEYPGQRHTHPEDDWAGATPDGYAHAREADAIPGLIEVKSAKWADEWAGDAVPPGYVDQCQWQMHVTGARRVYVGALVAMDFTERLIERDQDRIDYLRMESWGFLSSLERGEPPALDGSTHTYQAVRELHPDIDPELVEVPTALAHQFISARQCHRAAETDWNLARAAMADHMGSARVATWDGLTIATRKARNGGTPWVEPPRTLPTIGVPA